MMYRTGALSCLLAMSTTVTAAAHGSEDHFAPPDWMQESRDLLLDRCEEITTVVPVPCPQPPPPKLPKMCSGVFSKWTGDPHFKTFDGLKFDCQGEGEFTVLKSLDSDFELQGRFGKFNPRRRPTVTTAVAFQTGDGEPKLQVSVDPNDDECAADVYLDGVKTNIPEGRTSVDGISIQRTGRSFIFLYEGSDVQLKTKSRGSKRNGCVMDTDLCIPDCYDRSGERFVGLLGTPDGDWTNDWTSATGETTFDIVTTNRKEYEYCVANWCIREEAKSLFTYEGGNDSFDKYVEGCDLPPYEDDDCAADRAKIEGICGADNRECIVDGCVNGEDAAKEYVKSALNQIDRNCGKELAFEDFDGDFNYVEWGTKESQLMVKERSEVTNAEARTKYLSLHQDNSKLERTFDTIPSDTALVKLEYLFYEIGGWEPANHRNEDFIHIEVNDFELTVGDFNGGRFDRTKEGVKDGIVWSVTTVTDQGDLGFGSKDSTSTGCAKAYKKCDGKNNDGSKWQNRKCCPKDYACTCFSSWHCQCNPDKGASGGGSRAPTDQIYKVTLAIPASHFSDSLKFVMTVDMTGHKEDESAGVDNVRVVAFSDKCKIDCDGVTMVYEDFDLDEDLADWGSTETMGDGHVILGPLSKDSQEISKKFGVSTAAGYAKIDFLLYSRGSWEDDDSSKFWINIGGILFDVARFKDYETSSFVRKSEAGRGAIKWERRRIADEARLAPTDGGQIHLVSLEVSKEALSSGFLTLGFDVEARDGSTVAGIDDLRIRLFPDKSKCEQEKIEEEQKTCPKREEKEQVCYKDVKEEVCSPTAAPSDVPSESPTRAPTIRTASSYGDPHFVTWGTNGTLFDFHGACDLVLFSNDDFHNGLGFRTHVRTHISTWWSFIESAAVQVGQDTLEVEGGMDGGSYWINGQLGSITNDGDIGSLSGFRVEQKLITDIHKKFRIDLGRGDAVSIETYRKFVRVNFKLETHQQSPWNGGVGMLGLYPTGERLARDRRTIINDDIAFGKEWQVLETEEMLFHEVRGVQHPQECAMPTMNSADKQRLRRRLGESNVTRKEAEKACSFAAAEDKKACVVDVLATNDLDIAGSYA